MPELLASTIFICKNELAKAEEISKIEINRANPTTILRFNSLVPL